MPLPPGTPLGPYEVRELLGKGGMGEVYRARDRRLDRDVALKVISDSIASDSSARARFEREAKAIAALSHPNILSIFDFSKDQDHWYAVTELLQGETLRDRLRRGRLEPREAIEIAVAVTGGLIAAHERGIVHRDLKPENVFLTRDGTIKILDFGLAQVRKKPTEEEKTEVLATKAGQVVGTVTCMSPEQIRGETVDAATDIFSLGCMLYEMVAGTRPFCGDNPLEVVAAVLKDPPAPLPDDVPPELAQIIMRCLEKDPKSRFASARDLRGALETPLPLAEGGPKGRVRASTTRVIVLPFRIAAPRRESRFPRVFASRCDRRLARRHRLARRAIVAHRIAVRERPDRSCARRRGAGCERHRQRHNPRFGRTSASLRAAHGDAVGDGEVVALDRDLAR